MGNISRLDMGLQYLDCYHFATIMLKNMVKKHKSKNNENVAKALQINNQMQC